MVEQIKIKCYDGREESVIFMKNGFKVENFRFSYCNILSISLHSDKSPFHIINTCRIKTIDSTTEILYSITDESFKRFLHIYERYYYKWLNNDTSEEMGKNV